MVVKLFHILVISLLSLYLTSPAFADDFLNAKQLLQENKPEQAYQILTTKEAYHIGEPVYDLLLARTALRSGRPNEAIFAYERVLINNPAYHVVRVELAIAYYQIDQLENAQTLLDTALNNNPPDDIKKNILDYIERINEKINSRRHSLTGVLTLTQGWDSNINSATNASEIQLSFGTYRPTAGVDKETSDTFTEVANRLHYNYNLNVNSGLFTNFGYTNRENNHKQFDLQSIDFKAGYSHITAIGKISIPLSYQTMWLDEKQLREVFTISTSLTRSSRDSFSDYSLQYGEIRYPGQTALDVGFVAASLAFGFSDQVFGLGQQYAVFYGDETPANDLYAFNAREYWGLQAIFPLQISPRHSIIPKMVYQEAEYHKRHPFFLEKRKDHYSSYELTWGWQLNRAWSLSTQAGHTESDSSVSLYSHTRNTIFTGINFNY